MSLQVDYMFSALIPAEAIENNHEHLVAMKLDRYYHSVSLVTICV